MPGEEKEQKPKAPIVAASHIHGGLVPTDMEQLWRLSQIMSSSGMMPKGLETAEKVFVAVQFGLEIGLTPMAAVQSIAVINGRPTVWGDALLGLVMSSGLCARWEEDPVYDEQGHFVGHRVVTRRVGQINDHVVTFTLENAKRAKLLGKQGPWQDYPERMCRWRAVSWAARDTYPDVLKGLAAREEVEDIPVEAEVVETTRKFVEPRRRLEAVLAEANAAAAPPPEEPPEAEETSETTDEILATESDVSALTEDEAAKLTTKSRNYGQAIANQRALWLGAHADATDRDWYMLVMAVVGGLGFETVDSVASEDRVKVVDGIREAVAASLPEPD